LSRNNLQSQFFGSSFRFILTLQLDGILTNFTHIFAVFLPEPFFTKKRLLPRKMAPARKTAKYEQKWKKFLPVLKFI